MVITLDSSVPESEEIISAFDLQAKDVEYTLITSDGRALQPSYVGPAVCSRCHYQEYEKWKQTAHFSSLRPLQGTSSARENFCVSCHSTGFYFKSGYISSGYTIEDLSAVSCESCHGPGSLHTDYFSGGKKVEEELSSLPQVPKEACHDCHNRFTDPSFDFDRDWNLISH